MGSPKLTEEVLRKTLNALKNNNWNRTSAAKELGISRRTITHHIQKMNKLGLDEFKVESKEAVTKYNKEGLFFLMPTNEQRLRHLDRMLNFDRLWG